MPCVVNICSHKHLFQYFAPPRFMLLVIHHDFVVDQQVVRFGTRVEKLVLSPYTLYKVVCNVCAMKLKAKSILF